MARHLTASDRSALIRLASTMPKGSPERRAILSGLQTRYLDSTGHPVDFNNSRIVERYTINWGYEALKRIPGFKPDGSSLNYGASGFLTDGSILPSWTEGTGPNAVIGVRTGYLGGHVYIYGVHGYGEARTEPRASTDFKVFTRNYGSSPNDRTQTEPVEDPVQTIYDAIQETLKKFRKVKVTPLDPLKWQKYEGSRHLPYSIWGDILRRSQTVLEKEEAPKDKYTTVKVVRVWRWDKKDGHVWYTVERRGFGGMLDQSFNQSVFYRSPQAYDSLSKAKAAAKAHARRTPA